MKVLLIAVLTFSMLALIAGGVTVAVLLTGGDEAAATEVFLEPTGSTGANPFMASAGEDEPDVEPPPEIGGTFPGDTVGLYGGTTDDASCDPDQMVSFLEANRPEAEAWAGVAGIGVSEIATYVDTLTPVVLRGDTAVTNHGFSGGAATSFQAVLQAGTAVLVDANGLPVVKCGCGNPLLPPERTSRARYEGSRWPGFDEGRITVVQASTVQIDVLVLVDLSTGEPFGRPVGTDGDQDGPVPGTDTTATTPGPTATTADPPATTPATTPATSYDGTYQVTAQVNPVQPGANCVTSFTFRVVGSTVQASGLGGMFEVPLAADGSFGFSDAAGGISGRFDGETVSGTITGSVCTGTFQGQRTGPP